MTLTDLDRAVLDFEGQWWSRHGAKEQAIRDRFGVSLARHLQMQTPHPPGLWPPSTPTALGTEVEAARSAEI